MSHFRFLLAHALCPRSCLLAPSLSFPAQFFAVDKIQQNDRAVDYCRTIMAIVCGCACGVLGFKGLAGLAAHVLCSLLLSSVVYVLKARMDPSYLVSLFVVV